MPILTYSIDREDVEKLLRRLRCWQVRVREVEIIDARHRQAERIMYVRHQKSQLARRRNL